MTRDERIKAFTMRIDGYSWDDISEAVGYERATVFTDLTRCIRKKRRPVPIVYPALRELCYQRFDGSISKMALSLGMSESTLRDQMNGTTQPSGNTIRSILSAFDLTFEQAFGSVERD